MKNLVIAVLVLLLAVPASATILNGVYANQDSWMRSRSDLTVMNYGANTSANAHSDNDSGRVIVGFDPADFLPAITGMTINSATLKLHLFGCYDQAQPMNARRVTQAWNEGAGTGTAWYGVDWDAADYTTPGSSGSQVPWSGGPGCLNDSVAENPNFVPPTAGYASTGTYANADVTASLQAAANGDPFEGFLIKHVDEATANDDWFMIWTHESANTPAELIIDYVPEPATLLVLALGGLALIRRR